jgi:uncharacterized membrane protein HdeD (DUF308 family)
MNGEIVGLRNWWSLVLRGIAAVLIGLSMLIMPTIAWEAMVILFGAFAFLSGIFAILSAVKSNHGWVLVLQGILGVLIGLIAIFNPLIMSIIMLTVIAIWAVIIGGLDLVVALRLVHIGPVRGILVINGLLTILFGLLLMMWPPVMAIYLIGIYVIVDGLLMFGLGCHLHGLQKR